MGGLRERENHGERVLLPPLLLIFLTLVQHRFCTTSCPYVSTLELPPTGPSPQP